MKKIDLISVCIILIVSLISFLTSNNPFVCIGVLLVYSLYYFIFARKRLKIYYEKSRRVHQCYYFVTTYLLTMSIKESYDDAFENAIKNKNDEFSKILNGLEEMNSLEKIEYLTKYFTYSFYHMFLKVINLYQDQGGNILKMSSSLLNETIRIEETMKESENNSKKKTIEFFILWSLSFVVILFMRFALQDFYLGMLNSIPFFVLLVAFYVLFLVAIHIFIVRYTKMPINEEGKFNE